MRNSLIGKVFSAANLNTRKATTEIKVGDSIVVRRCALGRDELSDATVIETRVVNKYNLTNIALPNGSLCGDGAERGSSTSDGDEPPNHKRFKAFENPDDDNNVGNADASQGYYSYNFRGSRFFRNLKIFLNNNKIIFFTVKIFR